MSIQLVTKTWFGSDKQEMDMLLDTGSEYIWVASRICESCNLTSSRKFDERTSTSHYFFDAVQDLHYGLGDIYGYVSVDSICLNEDVCTPNVAFITVAY